MHQLLFQSTGILFLFIDLIKQNSEIFCHRYITKKSSCQNIMVELELLLLQYELQNVLLQLTVPNTNNYIPII